MTGGEIGPAQDQPIAASGALASLPLVARMQGDRLALYGLLPPSASSSASPSATPALSGANDSGQMALIPDAAPEATPSILPAPTPAPPAFEAQELEAERAPAGGSLAMASNGHKAVLAIAAPDAQGYRVQAQVWIPGPQGTGPLGSPLILARGPAVPSHLRVAVAPDGQTLAAWSAHLPGRPASLRLRAIRVDRTLAPMRWLAAPGFDLTRPAIAAGPGGFVLAYVKTAASPSPLPVPSPTPQASGSALLAAWAALDQALELPPPSPPRQIAWQSMDPDGSAERTGGTVSSGGLDHPEVVFRGSGFHVFWTDPRGGGRELRFRAVGARGWQGAELYLRTDLRPELGQPYGIVPVSRALWLAIYPQYELGDSGPMVLEGRLYYPHDYAISPPLLLARSDGSLELEGLFPAGHDTWIALWDALAGGQHHLDFRPLHVAY